MSRGKYASRAEKTAAVREATGELEALRRANAKLIAEKKAIAEKSAEDKRQSAARIQRLTAQLNAGTSDRVEALRLELDAARDATADERVRRLAVEARERKHNNRLVPWLMAVFNASVVEVVEMLAALNIDDLDAIEQEKRWGRDAEGNVVIVTTDEKYLNNGGAEDAAKIRSLRKARGNGASYPAY